MGYKGDLVTIGDKKILLIRGIYDYFDKNNFERLEDAHKRAKEQNAKLYVGVYSDELLEQTKHERKLKGLVSNEDRIFALESLDFVDGAFCINSTDPNLILQSLKCKIYDQEYEKNEEEKEYNKKYQIGYASGAFSNLHKGHIEHLKEMSMQCERVIVAANSDNLIQNYKNKKVSVDEETRRKILSHVRFVDLAIITDEYDKLKAIETVRALCGEQFDAIFVGSDWKGDPKWKDFEERLKKYKIDVVFTDRPENGISTTKIDKSKKSKENVGQNR